MLVDKQMVCQKSTSLILPGYGRPRSLKPQAEGSIPLPGSMETIIEVRAGDGGDDAALFATELAQALAVFTNGTLTSKMEVITKESL